MPTGDTITIDGEKLKDFRRKALGATQAQFARASGLSVPMIQTIERLGRHRMRVARFGELALRLGADVDKLESLLGTNDPMIWTNAVLRATWVLRLKARIHSGLTPAFDRNFNENAESIPDDLPTFNLSIYASRWAPVEDNVNAGQRVSLSQFQRGLFRVRVRGDCMEKKYPDGSIVEFKLLRNRENEPDFSALSPGRNYYVQREDGQATFKQLVRIDGGDLVLRPINRKYRGHLAIPLREVKQIAVAVGRFEPE